MAGFEPSIQADEDPALPLSYTNAPYRRKARLINSRRPFCFANKLARQEGFKPSL